MWQCKGLASKTDKPVPCKRHAAVAVLLLLVAMLASLKSTQVVKLIKVGRRMINLLWVSNVMPNVAEEVNLFSLSCLLRSLSCRLLLYRETDAIAAIPKFLKEIGN